MNLFILKTAWDNDGGTVVGVYKDGSDTAVLLVSVEDILNQISHDGVARKVLALESQHYAGLAESKD